MKFVALLFALSVSAYFYSITQVGAKPPEMESWKVTRVLNPDGTPSKYELMTLRKAVQIHANHRMGDGSRRYTIIEDSNGDNVVDRAYVTGGLDDDQKMYFNRQYSMGMQYYAEWQEEWDKSKHRIEKLLGRSIWEGGAK